MTKFLITVFVIAYPLIILIPGMVNKEFGFYHDWWTNLWLVYYFDTFYSSNEFKYILLRY